MNRPRAELAGSATGGRPPFECAPPRPIGVRRSEGPAEAFRDQDCDQLRPPASVVSLYYCSGRLWSSTADVDQRRAGEQGSWLGKYATPVLTSDRTRFRVSWCRSTSAMNP